MIGDEFGVKSHGINEDRSCARKRDEWECEKYREVFNLYVSNSTRVRGELFHFSDSG